MACWTGRARRWRLLRAEVGWWWSPTSRCGRRGVRAVARGGRRVGVADEQVWAAQGARLEASGLQLEVVTVPVGEASKSWGELERLIDRLLALEVERSDHIVAFGGGIGREGGG